MADSKDDIVPALRTRWEGMGDMANHERTVAADEIERLRRSIKAVREECERMRRALDAIAGNANDEPYAAEFAMDCLRNMTADEYAHQLRIELYRGEG